MKRSFWWFYFKADLRGNPFTRFDSKHSPRYELRAEENSGRTFQFEVAILRAFEFYLKRPDLPRAEFGILAGLSCREIGTPGYLDRFITHVLEPDRSFGGAADHQPRVADGDEFNLDFSGLMIVVYHDAI